MYSIQTRHITDKTIVLYYTIDISNVRQPQPTVNYILYNFSCVSYKSKTKLTVLFNNFVKPQYSVRKLEHFLCSLCL